MKILLIFSLALSTFSCQSEYDRQLSLCKMLVEEPSIVSYVKNKRVVSLKKVAKQIDFHAHLSGNERLFKLQLQEHLQTFLVKKKIQ